MEYINYYSQTTNSHFWSDLNQLLEFLRCQKPNKDFLLTGLKNTIKEGYDIKKLSKNSKIKYYPYFAHIYPMYVYVKDFYNEDNFIEVLKNTIDNNMNLVKTNKNKMERKEVYNKIDQEREYQDLKWGDGVNGIKDSEKPLSEWINYIEFHLSKAKEAVYYLKNEDAKAELRKVTAIGVRALEIHGCPDRNIIEDLTKDLKA